MASLFEKVLAAQGMLGRADRVDLWFVPSEVGLNDRDQFWQLLSNVEKQRALSFKLDRDRGRFIASHGVLRLILAAYCRQSAKALDFSTGPQGKPALTNPAARIAFNLSHAAGFALIGVSCGSACGVDIEEIRSRVSTTEIAGRFFAETENRWLDSLSPDQRLKGFFRLWTIKEAMIKAMGSGLSTPLNDLDAAHIVQNGAGSVTVNANGKETVLWISELDLAGGLAGAVAVEGREHVVRIIGPPLIHSLSNSRPSMTL